MIKKGWAILGGLLMANLAVFGALAYLFLSSPSSLGSPLSPSPSPTSPSTAATEAAEADRAAAVKAFYPLALEVATAWQGDARLASASADWPSPTAETLEDQEVPWSFNFYSPVAGKVYAVAVSGGQARGVRESQVPRGLNPAPVEGWQIDSPAALATWLANGGSDFLTRYPQAEVSAQLRFPSDSPTPLWTVRGADEQSSANFVVKVDAASGTIVE
jgi:hypothetical protein